MNRSRALLLLATLVLSCAQEPATRITVQADAIAKSDLAGVWYYRQTVVGVPFTTGFTFIGEQGDNEMEKIRWDIQEDVLTARRSYEWVKGSEKGEPSHPGEFSGAPVAAFKIKAQFDIVRDYNASTGEEYDKVVENTERKWYERKFLRVDWSENLISNFQFLADFDHGGISAIKQDPAPYYISDPKDPDALRLERPGPDQQANYLEMTQKIVAAPQSVDFEDEKNIPLCFLEYATEDCASQEIKIRNSFLRAPDGGRDYDTLNYDEHMMDRFGYFTTDRGSYNRQYGETETGRLRMINRFNLWQHNVAKQECQKDDECGGELGARCDKDLSDAVVAKDGTVTGRCTLPYGVRNLEDPANPASRDLGPRKIVYYLNDRHPADLIAAAQQLVGEYDVTYQGIYKTLTGKDAPGPIFVLCPNNPVKEGDAAECGPPGTAPRIGDLRYNMIYWVDEPTSARLLGYGPSSHDPETGETLSATAFIYGAEVDQYAAQARDIVRLVNGEIPPDAFVDGVDVKEWVATHREGAKGKTLAQADVDQMADQMDLRWTAGLPTSPSVHKASASNVRKMVRARSQALAKSQILGADRGIAANRLARLKGTHLERRLVNGELLLARGLDPRTPSTSIDASKIRPLSLTSPETARFIRGQRRRLGKKGVDLSESFDDAVIALALQQKGMDSQEVWRKLRVEVYRSTAEHEVGHTLGLRHNFAGSFDAMNYPKTYWDLRNAGGAPRPRYLDPETPAEQNGVVGPSGLRGGISEFQTSSIMDYGAKFNSDIQGIGKYDRAAIKFGYGQIVEVFNRTKDPYLIGGLQATVTFGYPQPLLTSCKGDQWISLHYTSLPKLVDLEDRTDVPITEITRSELPSKCAYPDAVDHDAMSRLVVPYHFCSDEFEGASSTCLAYDRGADVYEIAENTISTYQNYYLFNNFKRDRRGFNPEGYIDRIYERYLDPLRSQMQFYVLLRSDFATDIPDDGKPGNFWRSPDGWGPYTVAVNEGFNLLGQILTAPEPGDYYKFTLADGRQAYRPDPYNVADPIFQIGIPEGRFFETSWDYDSGYYWYERVSHIGSFLDKVAALAELTDPETFFVGADEASDVRQYAINYWRLYPKQMNDLWGATLTDRWDRFAPIWDGKRVKQRPIAQSIPDLVGNQLPIDPQTGFSVQLYASAFGIALIPATFDQSFMDSARLFLQGNGQQIDAMRAKLTFTDPFSGRIYVALSFPDANKNETGVAARMLLRAQELAARIKPNDPASETQLKSYIEVLEVVRTLTVAYADSLN